MMKPVGKPDAGKLHVRFDERGGETAHAYTRHRAPPRLYFGANRGADRVDDFHQEPTAILDATAVAVRASVGLVAQKLIDQIAVGGVDLHAIEPGRQGVSRA
jgi:hypothetical protein